MMTMKYLLEISSHLTSILCPGTMIDSRDQEMEIEEYIGKNMMDYIANTDKDEIIIRNDELSLDLDITKDARTYDEVMFG